jgi:hypothetical protein
MKIYSFILGSLLLASSLSADEKPLPTDNNVHRFQAGVDIFWSHARSKSELDENGYKFKATLNGVYEGLHLGYDYLQSDAFYAGTEAVFAWGRDHMEQKLSPSRLSACSSCQQDTTIREHASRRWINLEQRLGYNAQSTILTQFIVTPYLGIGWHYEGTSHDHASLYYGAAGLKTIQRFYERFELGFDFKATLAFDIRDKGFISSITTQGKKSFWGFETAIPLRWRIGNTGAWDLELKPYILKLNLNSSQTIIGTQLVVVYSF